jgi:putative tryptophan/tyrosine transport system substrate-binding protein
MLKENKNNLMKKLAQFALFVCFFVPFLAQAYTGVTIVISAATSTNLEFVEHFKAELASKNSLLRVKVIDLQALEQADTEGLVVAENSELVIALGVKALQAASKLKANTPVLGVFTPLPSFNSLLAASRRDEGNFSAIVLDQPYARQLSLIKIILPEAKNIGVLLGATSAQFSESLKEEADERALNLLQEKVSQPADLLPKLNKLLASSDVLMAIPDTTIYSRETAQPILLTSYRHKKTVFGYSQSYVRAGALAAVYSNKQIAKQAAEIAIATHAMPGLLPAPQAPKYFSIAVNYQVARSLDISLQDEQTLNKKLQEAEMIEVAEHEAYKY